MEDMQEDIFIKPFSERLTALRLAKNVSARDMSLSIGQSHNYIHNIEAMKNYPTMLNFFYICEYLKVTPQQFFEYDKTNPARNNILYDEILKLDEKSQTYFLQLIKDINNRPK